MGDPDWVFSAHGQEYSAPSVSSFILKALAAYAAAETGAEVRQVVITVPAYFGDDQRKATRYAGKLAGLEVVDIINEPVAAALSYGFAQAEAGIGETVLVFDLGGGTFDTTVIQISEMKIRTVATDGHRDLGGTDWDLLLAKEVARRFMDEENTEDPLDDDYAAQTLSSEVEEQKRRLTDLETTEFMVSYDGSTAAIPMTRQEFEELTSGLFEETVDVTRRVLGAAAAKGVDKIDQILLVGGSSRMPAIKRRLEEVFGIPCRLKDPDLAVATGAALYARKKLIENTFATELEDFVPDGGSMSEEVTTVALETTALKMGISKAEATAMVKTEITNVCSKAFGVGALKRQPNGDVDIRVTFLCHQNTDLPYEVTEPFETALDDQRHIHVVVYEQAGSVESDLPDDNKVVIEGDISDIPPGHPRGTRVDVTLKMGTDGTIFLSARHPAKSEPLTLDLRGQGEDPQHLANAQALVEATSRRD